MTIRLGINSTESWAAIRWFRDNYNDLEDPEFKNTFEQMFNCKVISSEPLNGHSVSEYLDFDDERCYTMFMLKWS